MNLRSYTITLFMHTNSKDTIYYYTTGIITRYGVKSALYQAQCKIFLDNINIPYPTRLLVKSIVWSDLKQDRM